MDAPITVTLDLIAAPGRRRDVAWMPSARRLGLSTIGLAIGVALLGVHVVAVPEARGALLVCAAMLAWSVGVVPDFVVALAVVAVWNLADMGPAATSLSGFSSPTWVLMLSVLTLGVALNRSGLLRRVALRMLAVFPPTFVGQSTALVLSGAVATPLLPLTVARCGLTAPLVVQLAEALGYAPRSRAAVGLGLAGFVGSGLLSRCFSTGAVLNVMAWGLLPEEARVSWGLWALAAAPVTLLLVFGPLALVIARFAPATEPPVARDAVTAMRDALGPIARAEWIAGGATVAAIAGFVLGPRLGFQSAWIACAAALVVVATGLVTTEQFRAAIDWPLLVFLGVVLSLPEMIRHTGLETWIADAVTTAGEGVDSPTAALVVVFLVTLAVRFVLSEWVAVPMLTVALWPVADAVGFHPWLVAFVVLLGANLWSLPYQFASYLAFYSASGERLFAHGQVRGFSIAFMALSLAAILLALPLWRLLDLV